jgi:creatinine amidohydrolase/Fe(II)-dependent formamide hydrolase-like protein
VEHAAPIDDGIVLPIGSTEQHAYLSLATDNILAERVAVEAAEPLGVLVLPVLPYGITPRFAAYPGSPTLRVETFLAVVTDLLDSLSGQGFRRILIVNGHGGNFTLEVAVREQRFRRDLFFRLQVVEINVNSHSLGIEVKRGEERAVLLGTVWDNAKEAQESYKQFLAPRGRLFHVVGREDAALL